MSSCDLSTATDKRTQDVGRELSLIQNQLARLARARTGNATAADDLLQETNCRVLGAGAAAGFDESRWADALGLSAPSLRAERSNLRRWCVRRGVWLSPGMELCVG